MYVNYVANRSQNAMPTIDWDKELSARFGPYWHKGAPSDASWKHNGRWEKQNNGSWYFQASPAAKAWANQMDKQYLCHLAKEDPNLFLEEMTPNPQHDGTSRGLDLSYPHHKMLQAQFRKEVESICIMQNLLDHPALDETPIVNEPSFSDSLLLETEVELLRAQNAKLKQANEQLTIDNAHLQKLAATLQAEA